MKSYKEIANSIFERRDKYIATQNSRKQIIISIVTSLICCCVVLITSFFINNIPVLDSSQNASDSSNDNSFTSNPPVVESDYFIDSIDKINFYCFSKNKSVLLNEQKKFISQKHSFFTNGFFEKRSIFFNSK